MLSIQNASNGHILSFVEEGLRRLYSPVVSLYSGGVSVPQVSVSGILYLGEAARSLFEDEIGGSSVTFDQLKQKRGAILGLVSGSSGGFSVSEPELRAFNDVEDNLWGIGSTITSVLGKGLRASLASQVYGSAIILGGSTMFSSNLLGSGDVADIISLIPWTGSEVLLAYEMFDESLEGLWEVDTSFVTAYNLNYWALQ